MDRKQQVGSGGFYSCLLSVTANTHPQSIPATGETGTHWRWASCIGSLLPVTLHWCLHHLLWHCVFWAWILTIPHLPNSSSVFRVFFRNKPSCHHPQNLIPKLKECSFLTTKFRQKPKLGVWFMRPFIIHPQFRISALLWPHWWDISILPDY
jgi:hypothetical protein